jgi:hypothetical protein
MRRTLRHAWAAAERTIRQQWRARLVLYGAAAAVVLALVAAADTASAARAASGVAFAVSVAVATTTIGVPGDDLASGALPNDLLAGTPPTALAVGAALGSLLSALPAFAGAVLVAYAPLRVAPASELAMYMVAIGCGAVALALSGVALGTVLHGRNASLYTVMAAFVGFVPPSAIRLDSQPKAVNLFLQQVWDALPLPHHVVSATTAASLGLPVAPHVMPLVVGAGIAGVAGILTLHVRIATGRWT